MVRLPVPNPGEREGPADNASGRLAFPAILSAAAARTSVIAVIPFAGMGEKPTHV